MTVKNFLLALAETVKVGLSSPMERLFGPRVQDPLIGSVTGMDLAVVFAFLLVALLAHGLAALVLRRKAREAEAEPKTRGWRAQAFVAAGKPLYLLIWIYGFYFAAAPIVLSKLSSTDTEQPVGTALDAVFDFGVLVVVLWLVLRLTRVLEARLQTWAGKSKSKLDDVLVPLLGKTARFIIPIVAIILALPLIGLPPAYNDVVQKCSSLLIIGAVSWILIQVVGAVETLVLSRYDISVADNLQARKIHTQVRVMSKTVYVIIGIFTLASGLMLFDGVRRFGTSILASAGVLGIIVGFAAQKTIANLFAGFQLALTQPIRLDDVVIVEGEWGRVEEITLTFVVVNIWDSRRLVVPLSYFIEKPFQNWTRVSADLLGAVTVWADYTIPIAELRREAQKIVESCPDWDRRFWNLQVTDATERAMQIRVLATAADSGKAWNLRCEIREKLIQLIQGHYPQSLPRVRADLIAQAGGERSDSTETRS